MSITSINNSRHYKWGEDCDGWHLVSSNNLSVIQERMPPGTSEARHYHEKSEQYFYVLKGAACIELNGEVHSVNEQEGLYVAAGLPHQVFNESDDNLEFIVVSTPHSHGDRTCA